MRVLICVLLLALPGLAAAQVAKKVLPRSINAPTYDHFAAQVTADGRELVFLSTYSASGAPTLKHSQLQGGNWSSPKEVKGLFKAQLDMTPGFGMSYDGQTMMVTSRRAPGIGGYDIWVAERRGSNNYSAPINLGKPVNSRANEGAPCLSADGKTMIFMRCSNMGNFKADGCALYITYKQGGRWSEPTALPDPINQGNSQYPRLLADGKTLIFSSDQHGGQGGMELLQTHREGDSWSTPVLLDFINDDTDNLYAAVPGTGDIVFYNTEYRGNQKLIMAKLPEANQPDHVYLIKGQVAVDGGGSVPDCMVQVYDAETTELLSGTRTEADGSYFVIMPEGRQYDVSVYPLSGNYSFQSELHDLRHMEGSDWKQVEAKLQPLQTGTKLRLPGIRFEDYDSTLSDVSKLELARLAKLLKQNPRLNIRVQGYIREYREGSFTNDPDLNLVRYDSTAKGSMPASKEEEMSDEEFDAWLEEDEEEAAAVIEESTAVVDEAVAVTEEVATVAEDELKPQKVYTTHFDTLRASTSYTETSVASTTDTGAETTTSEMAGFPDDPDAHRTEFAGFPADAAPMAQLSPVYHNDRSAAYARAVVNYLLAQGAPASRLKAVGMRDSYGTFPSGHDTNYLIEIVLE